MSVQEANFGWVDSNPTEAHDYLLPRVLGLLRQLYGDRSVRIMDLGCGNGYVASRLAELGHQVTGLDAARDGINIAQSQYPNLDFRQGSIYAKDWTDVGDGSFDCVLSLEVVEHLLYPRELFARSYRLTASGGHLIISTPYHGYWKNLALSLLNCWDKHFNVDWDGGHVKFFSKKTIQRMAVEAGFKNINIFGVGRLPLLWKSMILVGEKSQE